MPEINPDATFDEFAEDLLEERAARSLIIVGSSKVETLLLEILNTFLLPKISKPAEQDELLDGDRPLSAFSARIKLSYRLGLIDNSLRRALEKLRTIRNQCAHSVAFDLSKAPTRDGLSELQKHVSGRGSYSLTMNRYFDRTDLSEIESLQCLLLTLCVLLRAIGENVIVTKGNKAALRISSR